MMYVYALNHSDSISVSKILSKPEQSSQAAPVTGPGLIFAIQGSVFPSGFKPTPTITVPSYNIPVAYSITRHKMCQMDLKVFYPIDIIIYDL